ncbi:hypothetical protein Syun_030938 [Stephania yunnanensis]|uniref:Protein kinase domain-containing protein n=1 Tax=Stephania yunnanensis TaxID=152371 RepID=A0AAP0DVS6_9MAGN
MLTLPISTKNCQANVAAGLIIGSHGNNQTDDQLALLAFKAQIIHGIIPKELSSLQKLETLHLRENNLLGEIPDSLGNLSSLQLLNLSDNNLNGRIPNSLGQLKSLQGLGLGSNRLSSNFPPSIYNISSLQILSLPLNLIGKLPSDVGLALHNLRVNSFVGQLPANMGSMSNLQWLRLEANRLGSSTCTHRAEDLKFLSSIVNSSSNLQNSNAGHQGLDLSLNNLSREIPMFLQNLSSSSQYLDLSFNKGAMPTEGLFKNASVFSILGNNKLCGGILEFQLPLCPDHIQKHSNKKHQISLHLKVAIGVIVSTIVIAALLLAVVCFVRRPKNGIEQMQNNLHDHHERVSFLDLHRATDGFSPTTQLVQDTLRLCSKQLFVNEQSLHRNLIKILTACSTVDSQGNDFKALIFKFMPNGSLEKWLHPVSSDVERYITENLNLSRSLVARVGDFGLAKFLQRNKNNDSGTTNSTSSFSPRGTVGYILPEDMYSYGVLLLEMFTGKRQTDEVFQDGLDLHQLCKIGLHKQVMKIIDSHMIELKLEGNEPHQDIQVINTGSRRGMCEESGKVGESISSIVKVGVGCSMSSPSERMNIKDVLKELLAAKKFYESR